MQLKAVPSCAITSYLMMQVVFTAQTGHTNQQNPDRVMHTVSPEQASAQREALQSLKYVDSQTKLCICDNWVTTEIIRGSSARI